MSLSRYLAPTVLAASLGVAAIAAPAPAHAQSGDLARVLVDVADVVLRGGQPYYRHGTYDDDDRLIVQRDRYGNPVYTRQIDRDAYNRSGPPYGRAYGYHRNRANPVSGVGRTRCDHRGRCTTTYYDPRMDRTARYGGRDRYDRYDRYDRWEGGRRW